MIDSSFADRDSACTMQLLVKAGGDSDSMARLTGFVSMLQHAPSGRILLDFLIRSQCGCWFNVESIIRQSYWFGHSIRKALVGRSRFKEKVSFFDSFSLLIIHGVYVLDFPVSHKVFGKFDGSFVIAVNDSSIRSEMFSKELPYPNRFCSGIKLSFVHLCAQFQHDPSQYIHRVCVRHQNSRFRILCDLLCS